ncbi:MAG: hypothetical protein HIU89_12820 [Proteobacteria bacterium]|nr:hypothetical protein [Pseudomonadota bacterium]
MTMANWLLEGCSVRAMVRTLARAPSTALRESGPIRLRPLPLRQAQRSRTGRRDAMLRAWRRNCSVTVCCGAWSPPF